MKLRIYLSALLAFFIADLVFAQCQSWVGLPEQEDAENAHSIYRQALKSKEYDIAYENWKVAFDIAPAADGKRDYHFTDGAELYKQKWLTESDAAKKEEHFNKFAGFYDQAMECYMSGSITSGCNTDECKTQQVGLLHGRKAYEMFYTFNTPYSKTLKELKASVEKAGNKTEYIVFTPYASIAAYNFQKDRMPKEEVVEAYTRLNEIADFNIANNAKLSAYYQQAKDAMNGVFATVEKEVFDCDYFVGKLKPLFEEKPDDPETLKYIVGKLKLQGCEPGNAFYDEMSERWAKYAEEENERRQKEYEANNPASVARKFIEAGDYDGAINKFKEAIEKETDDIKKASLLHSMAQVEYSKLKKYSLARKHLQEAAKLRPGWGKPYITIGDMYASTARNCGDSWNQRLAILAAIEKYNYAKSIDSESASKANERIAKYRKSMPDQADGFMMGIKEGDSATVGCWIGERVRIRYAPSK